MALTTAQPVPARQAPPTRAARAAVLASAALTLMAAALIAPGLPAMSEEFAEALGGGILVRFVLTIASLAIAVSAPVSGLIADRVGRRSLLVAGLVLYAVSAAVGIALLGTGWLLVGTAGTVVQVLAGMLVGGTGVGLVVPNLNLRLTVPLAPGSPTPCRRDRPRGRPAGCLGLFRVSHLSRLRWAWRRLRLRGAPGGKPGRMRKSANGWRRSVGSWSITPRFRSRGPVVCVGCSLPRGPGA